MLGLNSEKLFASSGYGLDLSSIVQSTFPLYLFGTLTSWREGEGRGRPGAKRENGGIKGRRRRRRREGEPRRWGRNTFPKGGLHTVALSQITGRGQMNMPRKLLLLALRGGAF